MLFTGYNLHGRRDKGSKYRSRIKNLGRYWAGASLLSSLMLVEATKMARSP